MAGPLIGLGSSILGGILGRPRSQNTKSHSETTTTNTPIYGPKGRKLFRKTGKALLGLIENPTINEGLRLEGRREIGDIFNQQQNRLDSILASRGFGGSGKANLNMLQLERGRADALSQNESKLYQDALDRQMQALGLSTGFSRPIGFDTRSVTDSEGTVPGMGVGQAFGQAIGSAGSDISSWLMLQQIMNQQRARDLLYS